MAQFVQDPPDAEALRPTAPRSSVAPMDEAWYLTAPSVAYRIIIRHFYERHAAHHYHLSPEQVLAHIRERLPDYREEALRADLGELVRRRNLDEDLEMGLAGAKTVDDFRRRNSMFAITPLTAEIEALRVRWENQGRQIGELDGAAVARLWELLTELLEAIALPPGDPDRPERVRQQWEDLWNRFDAMSTAANVYIGNMRRQEREQLTSLEAFMAYKAVLVHYLTRFVEGLADLRAPFARRLGVLPSDDLVETLVAGAASGSRVFEDRAHLRRQYAQQVTALADWFAPQGDAEMLLQHARGAIERVTRAARRLADTRAGTVSRAQELLALAQAFSACADVRQAERLAAATFGLSTPRHWERDLVDIVSEDPDHHAWAAIPAEIPVQRRRTQSPRRAESAVEIASAQARREVLRERSRVRERETAALIDRWFAGGPLNLGDLGELRPDERDHLLTWVNDCLINGGQARTDSGAMLAILNPAERARIWLRAADGELLVPDYRLARVEEGEARGAAGA